MSVILYINGNIADLDSKAVIAQTKQVNDINSIDDRQASYTNKFKLPKTAQNIRIMSFATLQGNTSNIPYQKNECSLYSDTGECFVYKGWAVVEDSGNSYDVTIYDGIIDLYKAIENANLSQLNLTELNHTKDVPTIINSMAGGIDAPYTYILADYNGKVLADNGVLNTDYVVPAANVKYLWDKIFSKYGFTYSGSIFQTQNFRNLWLSYPKGVTASDSDTVIFHSNAYTFPIAIQGLVHYARFTIADINTLPAVINNIHYKFGINGTYKLKIKGKVFGRGLLAGQLVSKIIIARNNEANPQTGTTLDVFDGVGYGQDFEFESTTPYSLNANDTFSIGFAASVNDESYYQLRPQDDNQLEVTISYVDPANIQFGDSLSDFTIRDFLTEIVQRFGLTMFKDKYTNNLRFLTLQEIFQNDAIDWSSKFSRVVNENYIYGSYAQKNNLKYNYNDKEGTYNDGNIDVDNKNLPDSKDVIKSKIYSPEKENTIYLNVPHKVYRLWDKEIKEDGSIEYKPLDKRYYFLRRNNTQGQQLTLRSEVLNQEGSTSVYNTESYYRLSFEDVVSDYYLPLQQLLNKAIIVNAELYLNDSDVVNVDFSRLVYIEQLGNYYLVNKIPNYVKGKVTKVELVRVKYSL